MNLGEYLGSKKTKHFLSGALMIMGTMGMCMWASGGDPEKFKAFLEAAKPYVMMAVGLATAAVGAQGAADFGKEKAKIEASTSNSGKAKKP